MLEILLKVDNYDQRKSWIVIIIVFSLILVESMSTVEDFKSVSKTISSNLERDGMLMKQSSSVSLIKLKC